MASQLRLLSQMKSTTKSSKMKLVRKATGDVVECYGVVRDEHICATMGVFYDDAKEEQYLQSLQLFKPAKSGIDY